jgi:hypothetical protein
MTGDKHCGLNWIHTTSISTAAIFSCSLWRQYPSYIYGHGWTKATATVMISGTAILLIQYRFALLPLFSTFVADPAQKIRIGWRDQFATSKAISETVYKRGTTVPGCLCPSSTQIPVGLWLLYCQIIATRHWSRHLVHFTVCALSNEGILES